MTTPKRPFRVVEIDHLVLRVADLAASLGFYCEALGCTLERELPDLGLYQLRAGHQLIDLVPIGSALGGKTPRGPGTNMDHFCINITPFDAGDLSGWLDVHGIKHSDSARRYGAHGFGTSVYVTDPDGNTVELKSWEPVL